MCGMAFPDVVGLVFGPAAYGASPFATPVAAVAGLSILIGLFVVLRERGRQVSLSFFATTLALAIYQLGFSFMLRAQDEHIAMWWARFAYVGVPFIIPAVYHFSVHLLGLERKREQVVHLAWLIGIVYAELCLGTDLIVTGVFRTSWGYFTELSLWNLPIMVWSSVLLGLLIRDYAHAYQRALPLQRARIRWFAIPLTVACFGFVDYLPSMGLPVWPLGFVVFPVFLLSAAWAVERYHLPDLTPSFVADQVIAAMVDPLLVCDPSGRIAIANAAAIRLLGRKEEELRGRRIDELFADTDAIAFPELDPPDPASSAEREHDLIGRHGERIAVAVSTAALPDQRGRPVGFVVVARDIRERKRAAESLERREQHFRALIENGLDTITILDGEGRITYQSPSVREVLGYDPAADVGTPIFDRVHEDDRAALQALFASLAEEPGATAEGEARVAHAAGGHRVFELRGTNLLSHPAVRGVVVNGQDITEERLLEAQLQQAQKMEAVGRLAGGVAHDFNNILTAIQGYVALIREELPADSPVAEELDEVSRGADRAARLTDQLLAFGRRQVVRPELLELGEVVAGMQSMLQRLIGEEIELVTRAPASPGRVRADRGHIEQVLMNLVVNARDAMPGGGRIDVAVEPVELHERDVVDLDYHVAPGRYLLMTVADQGVGMDAVTRSRAFEPFFTTKPAGQGTGLGLSTVYGCVRQAAGYVGVESEPGRGTRFLVYLPLAHDPVPDPPGTAGAAPGPASPRPVERVAAGAGGPAGAEGAPQKTVLVVEDEAPVRALIRKILTRRGYAVLVARDGLEAVETAAGHPEPIDLLVADLVMPGLSGREVAERLRLARPGLATVFISGYTADEVVRRGIVDGEHVFLPKPFTPDALTRLVAEVLDEQAVARA